MSVGCNVLMRSYSFIFVILICSSCATLFNKKSYPIIITSNLERAQIQVNDILYPLPANVKVERSKEDLTIQLIKDDSTIRTIKVKSSPDPISVYGNLGWLYLFPIGYLIDYSSNKGFYYGKRIYLNSEDTSRVILPPLLRNYQTHFSKSFPVNKGQLNLLVSLPHINNYHQNHKGEGLKTNTGFGGISIGTEYYYNSQKSVIVRFTVTTDFLPPLPFIHTDYSGYYEILNSSFITVTNTFKFRRSNFAYGLSYSYNTWKLRYENRFNPPPLTRAETQSTNKSLGLTLNYYHQFTDHFYLGLQYIPSFLIIESTIKTKYEHLINVDLMWKIKLKT